MRYHDVRSLLLSMPLSNSDFPFDPETEVFRVHGKIFAICANNQSEHVAVNLKCDPDLAADLRKTWPEIQPGWHMNKRHWNTVLVSGQLPDEQIGWLVQHSYDCVIAGLPKKLRTRAKMLRIFTDFNSVDEHGRAPLHFEQSKKDMEGHLEQLTAGSRVLLYMIDEFEVQAELIFDTIWFGIPDWSTIRYLTDPEA